MGNECPKLLNPESHCISLSCIFLFQLGRWVLGWSLVNESSQCLIRVPDTAAGLLPLAFLPSFRSASVHPQCPCSFDSPQNSLALQSRAELKMDSPKFPGAGWETNTKKHIMVFLFQFQIPLIIMFKNFSFIHSFIPLYGVRVWWTQENLSCVCS